MDYSNPEIEALKEALILNRESLLNDLLSALNFDEINELVFQQLIKRIENADINTVKLTKALEAQEIIDKVLKDRLI